MAKLTTTSYKSKKGLAANQQYCVKVVAYNSSSVAIDSEAKNILIKSDFYNITVPKNVKAVATPTTVKVSFDKVSGATGYDILFDGKVYSVTTTSKTFSKLEQKTIHTYAVRAKNTYKITVYSTTQTIKTPAQIPTVPTGISKSSTESTVKLNWKASTAATGYEIVFDGTTYSVTGTSKVFTGLVANKKYTYKIRVNNENGSSSYGAAQSVTTLPKPPAVPTNVTATAAAKAVTVKWKAAAKATSYDVWFNGKVYNVAGTAKTIEGLTPSASYSYKVRAKNSKGTSAYSVSKDIKTLMLPPLFSPDVSATATTNSVTVKWGIIRYIKDYTVCFDGMLYNVKGTSVTFDGLKPGTTHTYAVCANNEGGSGAYSPEKTIMTKQVIPAVPAGINMSATANSVTVEWLGSDGAESYEVWFNESVYNTTDTDLEITGLTSNTEYSCKVCAKNSAGTSAYSEAQTVRTLLEIPTNVCAKAKSKK